MPLTERLRNDLAALVTDNAVVLFMKGDRRAPMCGFSATVVSILDQILPGPRDYVTVNVLESPELRDGIKEFSEWPTIPQLYVGGKFVGGSDIIREMHQAGELVKLVSATKSAPAAAPKRTASPFAGLPSAQSFDGEETVAFALPKVKLTKAAIDALAAVKVEEGDVLHLSVDANFSHDLYYGPLEPTDLTARTGSVLLMLDPASARRANGVSIDYVPSAGGGGFKIDNPNEPARVKSLTVTDLKGLVDKGSDLVVLDVRTDQERETASLPFARPFDADARKRLASMPKATTTLVFLCHHGVRSRHAAEQALGDGFRHVYNVEGGIDAWSNEVDPSVPKY